jgi:hypothetical protein
MVAQEAICKKYCNALYEKQKLQAYFQALLTTAVGNVCGQFHAQASKLPRKDHFYPLNKKLN